MPPPLLLLQDISLTFGVTPLLSGAKLAVASGDRVCLVGRNGSGKSTLLRIAAGLVQPDAGYRFAQPGTERIRKPSRVPWPKFARPRSHPPKSGGPERSSSRQAARPEPELGSLGTIPGGPSSTWLRRHFLRSAGP